MRAAVAVLLILAAAFAALAVAVDYGEQRRVLAQRRPPDPAETLADYRLEQLEVRAARVEHEHQLLTVLLVGNLVAVVASLATYIILERRRSGPR